MSDPTPAPEPAAAPDWPAVKALFEQALAQPEAERGAFVRAQPVSEAVQREVLSLLAHEAVIASSDAARHFLVTPPIADTEPQDDLPLLPPGTRLGAWQVDGPLGSGGMAEVMRAHRADGAWDGPAAIKVLKRGMDSAAVLARFALEQRALARLAHPHIARLLDAGRTDAGLPYFVMELIDGQPIDRACEGLPVEARLAMFLQLADAVAYAHRQLLVHRDLKPSNVLVTPDGQVKLLDFGIAKALDPTEGADAGQTAAGQRPFTPNFASPEQVRGEPVGTGTDIYSLGVLLYVMLTGLRPYGRGATTPQQAVRSVLEEEPTRPSALSPGLVTDPQWMSTRKRLRGDLDNILLKALDKTAERRYPSVDALAADVRAHLEGYPVSARAPSAGYLLGRFVRRNRGVVAAGTLAALALVAGTTVALWQARVARAERSLAQQRFTEVRQLANQLVFKYHDQMANLAGAMPVRSALLADAAQFLDRLYRDAADEPRLAEDLAGTYYRIARLQGVDQSVNNGRHPEAELNLDKAIDLSRHYVAQAGVGLPALTEAANMRVSRGELWQRLGRMQLAEQSLHSAVPLLDQALQRDPLDTAALTSSIALHGVRARLLGNNLSVAHLGRWEAACDSAQKSRAAAEATLRADPANLFGPDSLAFAIGELAQCRLTAGQWDQALTLFLEQQGLRDRNAERLPEDLDFRYQRAVVRARLAQVRSALGQHEAALSLLDEARSLMRATLAHDGDNAGAWRRLEAMGVVRPSLLLAAGRDEAARRAADEALAQWHGALDAQAGYAERQPRAEARIVAARAWQGADPTRALAHADAAVQLMQAPGPDDDNVGRRWMLAAALTERARALAAQGRRDEAARSAADALTQWQPAEGAQLPPPLQPWRERARALAAG